MVHLCICAVILWSLALSYSQHHDILTPNCFDTNCTPMGIEVMHGKSVGCLTGSLKDVTRYAIKQKLSEVEDSTSKRVFITDIRISEDKVGCRRLIIMFQPPTGNGKVMVKFGNISESCLPNQPCTQHSGDVLRMFSLSKTPEDNISHACITLSCNTQSYTGVFKVTLAAFPSHKESRGTPLVHHISYNKDDMVMSVARYPSENDIRVVFGYGDDYSPNSCFFSIFLCAESAQYPNITSRCFNKEPRLQIIRINQKTNSFTFKNLTSGKYSVEFVIDCQDILDAARKSYKLSSYFVQIPATNTKQEDDIDTDNAVFAIVGCTSGLILVVIMFIVMRRKSIHATCGVSPVDVKETDRQKITNRNCSIEDSETENSPFDTDFSTDVISNGRRSNHNKTSHIIDV